MRNKCEPIIKGILADSDHPNTLFQYTIDSGAQQKELEQLPLFQRRPQNTDVLPQFNYNFTFVLKF